MLVLTRKIGESIVIPEWNIVFTVLEVQRNKVRLGISAPDDVTIHRREVWMRLRHLRALPVAASAHGDKSRNRG